MLAGEGPQKFGGVVLEGAGHDDLRELGGSGNFREILQRAQNREAVDLQAFFFGVVMQESDGAKQALAAAQFMESGQAEVPDSIDENREAMGVGDREISKRRKEARVAAMPRSKKTP